MTFLQFCTKQFLYESDRELFKSFLGDKAEGERDPTEWWGLFMEFQRWLQKRKAKGG